MKDPLPPAGGPLHRIRVLIVAALLLASAAAGFLAQRLGRPAHVTLYAANAAPAAQAPPRPATTAPSSAPASPASRKVPEQMPDIALPDLRGVPHHLADWHGRPLLINFWATWCEPCRREIPLLKGLRHEHAASGLEVLGIAVDFADAARQYTADHGIDYPVLVGEQGGLAAVSAFGMDTVLPFSVFVDRQGRILTLKVGELHHDEAELILGRLREVETGQLTLSEAQSQVSAGIQRLNSARVAAGG